MEDIIRITNLDKRFGSVHAVNDLSFKVKKGELFAFLGKIDNDFNYVRAFEKGRRLGGSVRKKR